MGKLLLTFVLLMIPLRAAPCFSDENNPAPDRSAPPEWKSAALAAQPPAVTPEPAGDVPVYIGTTGFAWAPNPAQDSRRRWGFVSHPFGRGGFLFSHGPVGNFTLLGGARNINPRASFFSGFGIRRIFALRRKR